MNSIQVALGLWSNGLLNGKGYKIAVFENLTWKFIDATFIKGEIQSHGISQTSNNGRYEGPFKDSKR